jgi:hypothetical protein
VAEPTTTSAEAVTAVFSAVWFVTVAGVDTFAQAALIPTGGRSSRSRAVASGAVERTP